MGTITRRLFDEDAYIHTFDTVITAVQTDTRPYYLELAETAFYPEGGGQAGDTGRLYVEGQCLTVADTREKDGRIRHILSDDSDVSTLKAGDAVHGELDWDARFERMQNHSGEHIVSGLIHEAYGYENVGFHMGHAFITIDFNGPLTMEQLREIEWKANKVIWTDRELDIRIYKDGVPEEVTYRSKKALTGDVRIVSIPGADVCACCGTHVARTGEIGLISIFSVTPLRGGVRVEMLCGGRALRYLTQIFEQNHAVSVALSAPETATAAAVDKLKAAAADTSFRLMGMQNREIASIIETLADKGDILYAAEGYSMEQVRKLCVGAMEVCGGTCLVLSGSDDSGYAYAIGRQDGDLKGFVKDMNAALEGRGGGRPYFLQGNLNAPLHQITAYMQERMPGIRLILPQ